MIVRKIVHCIFAGTRFCCSKKAKCCKFFLNRQSPVRYEVYDRVCKENPLQRVHSCGRQLAGISEIPEHSGRKGEEYGKVHTFENGKKMRVVPSLERCNGQHNDPDENEGLFPRIKDMLDVTDAVHMTVNIYITVFCRQGSYRLIACHFDA